MSTTDVEDLLAEQDVLVGQETVRLWVNRFGRHVANCIRRDIPRVAGKWHPDDVIIQIRDRKF